MAKTGRISFEFVSKDEVGFKFRFISPTGDENGVLRWPLIDDDLDPGVGLWQALMSDPKIRDYWVTTFREEWDSLELHIVFNPNIENIEDLYALPWEYLNDEREYLGLRGDTHIVRAFDGSKRSGESSPEPTMLHLVVVAFDYTDKIGYMEETRKIKNAIPESPTVKHTVLKNPKLSELRDTFKDCPCNTVNILVVIAHASFIQDRGQGIIRWKEGGEGKEKPLKAETLSTALNQCEITLTVLNGCKSGQIFGPNIRDPYKSLAGNLCMKGFPAVIAMSRDITDPAAIIFSERLFNRLANNDTLMQACSEGRIALRLENQDSDEWATPILFLNRGSIEKPLARLYGFIQSSRKGGEKKAQQAEFRCPQALATTPQRLTPLQMFEQIQDSYNPLDFQSTVVPILVVFAVTSKPPSIDDMHCYTELPKKKIFDFCLQWPEYFPNVSLGSDMEKNRYEPINDAFKKCLSETLVIDKERNSVTSDTIVDILWEEYAML